jgi:hypothetical protein
MRLTSLYKRFEVLIDLVFALPYRFIGCGDIACFILPVVIEKQRLFITQNINKMRISLSSEITIQNALGSNVFYKVLWQIAIYEPEKNMT